jgi:hypothetical protein
MANFKTTDYIAGLVYGLLGSITKPKYLFTKPSTSTAAEYVVINSLPINSDVMQKCYVNVNYHVKDITEGVPDIVKMAAGSVLVLTAINTVSTTGYLIDFESQEIIREDALGEHYTNLRFSIKFINN